MTAPAWDPLADLSPAQRATLDEYAAELATLTRHVNLISPTSAADVEERHLVHSLCLAHRDFPAGATVVDWGAGGGLPSVPLAIRFPEVQFVAVDAVGKKAEAIRLFARRLSLPNLEVWAGRAEAWPGRADYAVSRATAPLANLWTWFTRVRTPAAPAPAGAWQPGLVCLKGGNLDDEIAAVHSRYRDIAVERIPLLPLLERPYFLEKAIVAVTEPA
jgi:16S rRNA (guanine527-N7)-methyltransferase